MAAALLAGAPFANEAFAADPVKTEFQNHVKLAAGVQFYANVKLSYDADNKYFYFGSTSGEAQDYLFSIGSYSSKTFTLYATGKVGTKTVTARVYVDASADNGTFLAKNVTDDGTSIATTTEFNRIWSYVFAGEGQDMIGQNVTPKTSALPMDSQDLNNYLSGKGFKLSFPGVAVQPDDNPFGSQMIAFDAKKIAVKLGLVAEEDLEDWDIYEGEELDDDPETVDGNPVVFVVADAAGKKLLAADGFTKDNLKAASFVTINPNKNFGITGLTVSEGEGYDFTTVKGENLKLENKKAKGYIDIANAVFVVTELDQLNAADEYEIVANPTLPTSSDENGNLDQLVYVGAYSLTAGGLKSYVTTVSEDNTDKLTMASTGGNTYVATTDLLKSSKEAAIYNIYFQGNDGSRGKSDSYYGKYLTLKASGDTAAVAPGSVNKNLAEAQWAVYNVENKGLVTFLNVYTHKTVQFKLYKTDEAGVYQASFAKEFAEGNPKPTGAGEIKLIAAKEQGSFLTLTDSQLARQAGIVFNGSGAVTVGKIYPQVKDERETGADDPVYKIYATSDADKAATWMLKKSSKIEHALPYVYLNGNAMTWESAKCNVQTYNLVWADDTKFGVNTVSGLAPAADDLGNLEKFAFKVNPNGTYTMIKVAKGNAEDVNKLDYADIAKDNTGASRVSRIVAVEANSATPTLKYVDAHANNKYNTVSVDIAELGESLPAVSRHATFEGIDGGISAAVDAKNIIHAVIAAEPLTFWLDTADSKAETPKFYISFGIAGDDEEEVETKADEEVEPRFFLYTPTDSTSYWDANQAKYVENPNYYNAVKDLKAIYRPAALVAVDTIATLQGAKEVLVSKEAKSGVCVDGLEKFQFAITKAGEDYVITNHADKYLYNLNGVLGFTTDVNKAMVVTVGEGDPTANEAIEAEANVQVIGGQGVVTVQGAAGKVVTVANILGQTIANQVAASDNVTIAAPAGVVVVSVDGEATKVIVK